MPKVRVTLEEKNQLEYYLTIMNNQNLPIGQRRIAKMKFDMIYNEALKRTIYENSHRNEESLAAV
ncbi:hypothetical protein CN470_21455 [Bacillus cereus]|uniref:hypothetical protein n=1 Tax=Bacillus cereus group TaxID=86661 RepID=UPI000BFA4467|nr:MULTISPECIES: hypothetical protein [Bacillus cereus group]PEQ59631.1 hypothetical protein CN470_21455 [Bacillus cereus]PGP33849.1 hypothetical protein COA06_32355 [Bacillus thuringiensis]